MINIEDRIPNGAVAANAHGLSFIGNDHQYKHDFDCCLCVQTYIKCEMYSW